MEFIRIPWRIIAPKVRGWRERKKKKKGNKEKKEEGREEGRMREMNRK